MMPPCPADRNLPVPMKGPSTGGSEPGEGDTQNPGQPSADFSLNVLFPVHRTQGNGQCQGPSLRQDTRRGQGVVPAFPSSLLLRGEPCPLGDLAPPSRPVAQGQLLS